MTIQNDIKKPSFKAGKRVGDTGIEPVTSSVSGKRAPAAPIARADDGTRTRDPHLGKVMLYQLSHIRINSPCGVQVETYPP